MNAVLERTASGELIRKAGIMGIVVTGGQVKPDDRNLLQLPEEPYKKLECV